MNKKDKSTNDHLEIARAFRLKIIEYPENVNPILELFLEYCYILNLNSDIQIDLLSEISKNLQKNLKDEVEYQITAIKVNYGY